MLISCVKLDHALYLINYGISSIILWVMIIIGLAEKSLKLKLMYFRTVCVPRFTPTVSRQQSETESLRTKSLTLPSRNTLQQQHLPSIGLHSVQLLPTIVSGET